MPPSDITVYAPEPFKKTFSELVSKAMEIYNPATTPEFKLQIQKGNIRKLGGFKKRLELITIYLFPEWYVLRNKSIVGDESNKSTDRVSEATLEIMCWELDHPRDLATDVLNILLHELSHYQFAQLTPMEEIRKELRSKEDMIPEIFWGYCEAISLLSEKGVYSVDQITTAEDVFYYLSIISKGITNHLRRKYGTKTANNYQLYRRLLGFDENLAYATEKYQQHPDIHNILEDNKPRWVNNKDYGDGNRHIRYLRRELYGFFPHLTGAFGRTPEWRRVIENWQHYLTTMYDKMPAKPKKPLFRRLKMGRDYDR